MVDKQDITAIVLAGGKARRMHQQDKGLLRVNGKPLVRQVVDAVKGQVVEVKISANRHIEDYQKITECTVVVDKEQGYKGPLMGVLSVMETVQTPYVLLLPCDAPYIKPSLVEKLSDAMQDGVEVCIAHDGKRSQYTFALLKTTATEKLRAFLSKGGESFKAWYPTLDIVEVDCSGISECFVNVNTAQDIVHQLTPYLCRGVPVLGFVGFSGAGKTTLLTQVITDLKSRGKQVAVIKHTHHSVDMDTKGKDSYRFRESGAEQVIVGSGKRFALLVEQEETSLLQLFERLDVSNLDFIIFEGFKHEALPKIEVYRPSTGKESLWKNDVDIIAMATDVLDDISCAVPMLDMNDSAVVVEFLLAYGDKKTG